MTPPNGDDSASERTGAGSPAADRRAACRTSYDRVADEYVRRIADELRHKPLDRRLLDDFAAALIGRGTVCDLGCGPGHVARYLKDRGADSMGLDLSPGLVERARALHPDIPFEVGDMTALTHPDGAWAGIAAFYSLLHVPEDEMPATLRGLHRVLQPGGLLLAAFHIGEGVVHLDEWWGHAVDVEFRYLSPEAMTRDLVAAGFSIEEALEREPYPDVEHPSRRAYIRACRRA